MTSLTKVVSTSQTTQMPSRQEVLRNSSLLANILSYISPWELRRPYTAIPGNHSVFGTCNAFESAAEKTRNCFLRTAQEQGHRWETSMDCTRRLSLRVLGKPITNQQMLLMMEKVTHLGLGQEDFQRGSESIEALLQTRPFPQLRSLTIRIPHVGPTIEVVTMKTIATQCPNLQEFSLHFYESVCKESFLELASLKHLEKVSFANSRKITDAAIEALATIPSITDISLENCAFVTENGIGTLLEKLPNLRRLDIRGVQGIGAVALPIALCGINLIQLDMDAFYQNYQNPALRVQYFADVLRIAKKCTKLVQLNLHANAPSPQLDSMLAAQLMKLSPTLKLGGCLELYDPKRANLRLSQ